MVPLSAWIVNSVAGRSEYGPLLPVRREGDDDERRRALEERGVVDDARSERIHEDVGGRDEVEHVRVVDRTDDRALAGVEELEQGTVFTLVQADRRTRTERVALRRFDLDHLGARVSEQLRAVGTGDLAGALDDSNAVQDVHASSAPCRCSAGPSGCATNARRTPAFL